MTFAEFNVGVKVAFEHEIRRVSFTGHTFLALRDLVTPLFSLAAESVALKYKDEDGDLITMVLSFVHLFLLAKYLYSSSQRTMKSKKPSNSHWRVRQGLSICLSKVRSPISTTIFTHHFICIHTQSFSFITTFSSLYHLIKNLLPLLTL